MRAIVIGGGIVGLSSAHFLRAGGFEVTVLEKGDFTDNCSFGNMGYLSPSHFVPLAAPGMIEQGLLWMFDKKSPFYIRPQLSARLARWGWRFFRSSTQKHVENSSRPLAELLLFSKKLVAHWASEMDFEYAEKGCIMYYRTAQKEKEELDASVVARDLGLNVSVLSREEIHRMEPDLLPDVRGGVWFQDDAHLYPNRLMELLAQRLRAQGVAMEKNSAVVRIDQNGSQIKAVHTADGRSWEADVFVLAAGSWSPEIAKLAGDDLCLMPGKGYSMTIPVARQKLNHPCILLEAKVAITPYATRLRIGSTMEIGPINDRILFPRVEGILKAVPEFLPGYSADPDYRQLADLKALEAAGRERIWYGFRPVSPDGMPYIGYSPRLKNMIWATGHAMLGLSLGPGTGYLVAQLAAGKQPDLHLKPYAPGRFA